MERSKLTLRFIARMSGFTKSAERSFKQPRVRWAGISLPRGRKNCKFCKVKTASDLAFSGISSDLKYSSDVRHFSATWSSSRSA